VLRPPSAAFLTDRVAVVPPSGDLDPFRAPTLEDTAEGVEHPCAVQGQTSGMAADSGAADELLGVERRTLVFASDPGVVVTGQTLRWLAHGGVPLDPPILFRSLAAARAPGGLAAAWRVDVQRLST
jgi:hypothetical protein